VGEAKERAALRDVAKVGAHVLVIGCRAKDLKDEIASVRLARRRGRGDARRLDRLREARHASFRSLRTVVGISVPRWRSTKNAAAPIIAPLSVHKRGGGTMSGRPIRLLISSRSARFAATPPPRSTLSTACSAAARATFSASMSVIAF